MSQEQMKQLAQALERSGTQYKKKLIESILEHSQEVVPELIQLLDRVLERPMVYVKNMDYVAHLYAVLLLGHLKDSRAHKSLIAIARLEQRYVEALFGELITEEFPAILYRTCGGDSEQLKALVQDKTAYDFCRTAGIRALSYAAVDGVLDRDEVAAFLGTLFTGQEADKKSYFWSVLVASVCEMYPEEFMEKIQNISDQKLVDDFYAEHQIPQKALEKGKEVCLADTKSFINGMWSEDVFEVLVKNKFTEQMPTSADMHKAHLSQKAKQEKAKKKQKKKRAKASKKKK